VQGYRFQSDKLLPVELPASTLAANEVEVRVGHFCLSTYDLEQEVCPGMGLVGEVSQCGEAATAFQDAHVMVAPIQACGECYTCQAGAAPVCPQRKILGETHHGGCAQFVVCDARWLTKLEGSLRSGPLLSDSLAAMVAGPVLHAYTMFCKAGTRAGDVVIVQGQGPVANTIAQLASSRGAKVARANTSQELEAELTTLDVLQRPQKIFVCDRSASFAFALSIAHPQSILVSALPLEHHNLDNFTRKELTLLACMHGHPDLLPEVAALVAKEELLLKDFMQSESLSAASSAQAILAFQEGKCLVLHHA